MVEQHYQELGRNLTSKQRNFVLYYIQTNGNGPEAAMRAYNCSTRGSARVIAHRNRHNPKIIAYRDSLWSEHNLVERSIRTLAEGMKANKTIITNRKTGESVEVPDHNTRLHAAKMALKLRGVDWFRPFEWIFSENGVVLGGKRGAVRVIIAKGQESCSRSVQDVML